MLRSEAWMTVTLGICPPTGKFRVRLIPWGAAAAAGAGFADGTEDAPKVWARVKDKRDGEGLKKVTEPEVPACQGWPDMQESLETQSGSSGHGKLGSARQPPEYRLDRVDEFQNGYYHLSRVSCCWAKLFPHL